MRGNCCGSILKLTSTSSNCSVMSLSERGATSAYVRKSKLPAIAVCTRLLDSVLNTVDIH